MWSYSDKQTNRKTGCADPVVCPVSTQRVIQFRFVLANRTEVGFQKLRKTVHFDSAQRRDHERKLRLALRNHGEPPRRRLQSGPATGFPKPLWHAARQIHTRRRRLAISRAAVVRTP